MAVSVREGIDYRLLDDDYRRVFKQTYNAKKGPLGREYYRCIYCGKVVSVEDMQVDHIIPKTRLKAGLLWNPNKAWNLGPSCGPCNASKSNYLDSRVLIGFRNKMLSNFGLIIADKGEGRGENQNTTALISIMIAMVSFVAMVVLPIFGMAAYGGVTIFNAGKSVTKSTFKFGKKYSKRYSKKVYRKLMKKPLRNVSVAAVLIYIGLTAPDVYTNLINSVFNIINILKI